MDQKSICGPPGAFVFYCIISLTAATIIDEMIKIQLNWVNVSTVDVIGVDDFVSTRCLFAEMFLSEALFAAATSELSQLETVFQVP